MSVENLKAQIQGELETIFDRRFSVEVSNTGSVPHSSDPAITFPNLDTLTQRCKIIETCVLYIDIRRSTELNIQHKPHTVAKLYSAFVRAMTYCAAENRGHVRGIIGDRIMVIFNPSTCFGDAVDTAILMNSTAQHLLNKHFTANEVKCGIGIDYGRMMVTKTGIRRNGVERNNYHSLVWLGRPANVASKLTDAANKYTSSERPVVNQAQKKFSGFAGLFGLGGLAGVGSNSGSTSDWDWSEIDMEEFLENLEVEYSGSDQPPKLKHKNPRFQSFFMTTQFTDRSVPPILMTKVVWDGYKRAHPQSLSVVNSWFKKQSVKVPGYTGEIYGGDVYKSAFKQRPSS